ncbi:MAG TPA: aminotransferase class V-fold PLP-dependent enzyme [Candidatus Elarobacter sp.]
MHTGSFSTRAVRLATARSGDPRPIAAPIHLSTTFERDDLGAYSGGFEYARERNPNRVALEEALAALEGGAEAAAFASGMAAAAALFQALRPGDHAVVANDAYWGVRVMLDEVYGPWGLTFSFVDCTDAAAVAAAMQARTRLVFIETPSNPLIRVTDVAAVAAIARAHGALLACDNTAATPVLQQPLALGADLVVHSTTKALSGNHDAMGGALVTKDATTELWSRIRLQQRTCGAIASPFNAWLTLRGIGSLVPRVRWQNESALTVARFLAAHAAVAEVLHPAIPTHPQHGLAMRQMSGIGGLFSIRVRGGREAALAVTDRLTLFRRATSFGGVESLVEHRASVEAPTSPTPDDLLRLAIGLEDPADLIDDLDRALRA